MTMRFFQGLSRHVLYILIVENAGTAFAFPSVSIYQEVQAQGMVANPPVDMTVNKEET